MLDKRPLWIYNERMIIVDSQGKRRRGFSLVEVAVAMAIISIAAFGSLAYQYLGAKHLKIARDDFTATRVGQMIIEDWKSEGGTTGYNPTTLGFNITGTWPNYVIPVDGITLHITLTLPTNADTDPSGYVPPLLKLIVTVSWQNNGGSGVPPAGSPSLTFTTYK